MEPTPFDRVGQALARTLADLLMDETEVSVPDLGTFSRTHAPARLEDGPEGPVLHPPHDTLSFTPVS